MDDTIELVLLNSSLTSGLFDLVNSNRAQLREWLPWVDTTLAVNDTQVFVDFAADQYRQGKGAPYAVMVNGLLCGVCGFNRLCSETRMGEIGYWLAEPFHGRGLMTQAVKQLIQLGFQEYNLNRIEILCAAGNTRSRAIPERLNMQCEAVLRQRLFLNNKFHDIALYAVLADDFADGEKPEKAANQGIEFLLSTDYETAVQDIKEEMLPYYLMHNLEWSDERKLQRYQECSLWKIVAGAEVGFLMLYEKDDLFYIAELYIRPEFRNKGFGSAAIESAKSIAIESGYSEIRIGVFKTNPAFELYKKLNFELEEEGPYTYQLIMKVNALQSNQ